MKLHFQFTHYVKEKLVQTLESKIRDKYSENKWHKWSLWIFQGLATAQNQKSMEMWTKLLMWCRFHWHPSVLGNGRGWGNSCGLQGRVSMG